MPGFLVLSLPRSRSYWLSKFLSYGEWHCGHDELQHMRSLEDVRTWFTQPQTGTVETAAAPFWRLIQRDQPDLRIVTVRRDPVDVLASVMRVIPGCDPVDMLQLLRSVDRKLDQVEHRIPRVLSVQHRDLVGEAACARVFEHCLHLPHDRAWWTKWRRVHASGNLAAQVRYCVAYLPALQKLARAARQATLADLARRRADRLPLDGFVFADEPFDRWLADAQLLFRDHLGQTGQDVDGYALKNLPLGRQLDAAGAMQICTARQNGRLFGYSMAVMSPTLDERDILTAQMMLPYADPAYPGLGRRLLAAAIEMLQTKGVSQISARAGLRGDGPRLGTMYRRMGFADDGALFRLNLDGGAEWAS